MGSSEVVGILGFTVVGIRSGFGDWNGKRTSKGREGWRFGVVGIKRCFGGWNYSLLLSILRYSFLRGLGFNFNVIMVYLLFIYNLGKLGMKTWFCLWELV